MSIKIVSGLARRSVWATFENRLRTCTLNSNYHWRVRLAGQFPLANQIGARKFNRLGRAWVFPEILVHPENFHGKFTPIQKSRFLVTSMSLDNWRKIQLEKKKYVEMPISEKRSQYRCGSKFTELGSIPTWPQHFRSSKEGSKAGDQSSSGAGLSNKVSMWEGDITTLEIDAIVNAANRSLLGGGGVDGAIHRAAGPSLVEECKTLAGCETGEAKITGGYKLPAKNVIHTVGPQGEQPDKLKNCYKNCLQMMKDNNLRTIAFPCISTGVYGYPNQAAAHVALDTTKQWLTEENNSEKVDRIIFCLFLPDDIKIYEKLLLEYFSPE